MKGLSTYAHGEFLHVAGIMHNVRYQIILRLETREGGEKIERVSEGV